MPDRVRIDWRHKGGRKPENTVAVARPSRFGNPYRVGDDARDNAEAVRLYRKWIEGDSVGARLTRGEAIAKLKGKDLACYCDVHEPCHADVLLELVGRTDNANL